MKDKILTISLIFQVLYFTQVYPYAHIHHAHQGGDLKVVLSVHPVDVYPEDHEAHHPDGNHHETEDHFTVERSFLGQRASLETPKGGTVCFLSILSSSACSTAPIRSGFSRSYPSFRCPENRFVLPQTSRGPPGIA